MLCLVSCSVTSGDGCPVRTLLVYLNQSTKCAGPSLDALVLNALICYAGVASSWPALTRWTNRYLVEKLQDRQVGFALSCSPLVCWVASLFGTALLCHL